ncbi:MAG: hypothetical protein U9N81_08430 [Bacillota bacterium]|nr:hypothetical protein [Bacillota bacterium]
MHLEEAVYSYLITQTAVYEKIADRLYPLLLPQKCQLPAVAYTMVSVDRSPALQKDTGFVKDTLQFSCHAKSYSEAVSVAKLLRNALQDFNGNMNGIHIGGVLVVSETVNYESATKNYSAHIEFEFHFNEE